MAALVTTVLPTPCMVPHVVDHAGDEGNEGNEGNEGDEVCLPSSVEADQTFGIRAWRWAWRPHACLSGVMVLHHAAVACLSQIVTPRSCKQTPL